MFFALLEDIQNIIESLEIDYSLSYYKTGLFETTLIPTYNSLIDVPFVGYTKYGDWNYTDTFLALPKKVNLIIREIPQKKGGTKYAIDQMANLESIAINLGGIYSEKENVLTAGKVGTISDTIFSINVYESIAKKIRKSFKKVGSFYVGKAAEEKLQEGWRLVTNEKLSKGYDLAF